MVFHTRRLRLKKLEEFIMDMDQIGNNIVKAFLMILKIVGVIGGIFIALFVITLVIGIMFGLVTTGSISTDTATNTTMVSIQGNFTSLVGQITTSTTTAGGLIVVAIVLLVFGGIGVYGYQKLKGKKDNSGGY